ncbi:MAG: hypothetical protein J0I47_01580 [Sphingomonas sp.]|uniref:hypothetical protein n=1 Tax=Sphingomonas sp. TaxID=28214 RepID=UPI001AD5CAF9|nr:hypothetical protein [Sphingomonas sp.]MBN8806920.1 hypothetical protein [Sphingomonas sp.]
MKLRKMASLAMTGALMATVPVSGASAAAVRASQAVPAKVSADDARREVGGQQNANQLHGTGAIVAVLALLAIAGGIVAATSGSSKPKSP